MPKQAQRSLEIYDREGEEAMIAYLMFANRHPDNQPLWDTFATCVMPDQSVVKLIDTTEPASPTKQSYRFQWTDEQGEQMNSRPASIQKTLPPPAPCQTAISWPHTDSIQLKIMERVHEEAHQRMNMPYNNDCHVKPDDNYTLSMMHRLAPSARPAVNQAIDENSQPESIIADLEALEYDWVDQAIEHMEQADFENLVQNAIRELGD